MQSWRAGSRGTQVLKITLGQDEEFSCVMIDELTQSVFAGTSGRTFSQINLRSQRLIKKYSDLGTVIYKSSFGNLLFVGVDSYQFTIISITGRKVLISIPVKIPIQYIHSVHFTLINWDQNPRVALTVSGGKVLLLC